MATLDENYKFWNERYNWTQYRGDQWSAYWGGPQAQWDWCVYPRIRRHLPAPVILEIGAGQGRWTRFLKEHCDKLIVTDISEKCLEVCRERFDEEKIQYHLTDGCSLPFLEEKSVDFIFSFESLIHTEIDSLNSYLRDLSKAFRPQGKGFLHHSNLGDYASYFRRTNSLPQSLRRVLTSRQILDSDEWRAPSVTHQNFKEAAESNGLSLLSQELIPWGGRRFTDCFSVFQLGASEQENQVLKNSQFIQRAEEIRCLSQLHSPSHSWLSGSK